MNLARVSIGVGEEVSELVWHPEEPDADMPLGWRTRIASQALDPPEAGVSPLGTRKDHLG